MYTKSDTHSYDPSISTYFEEINMNMPRILHTNYTAVVELDDVAVS